MTRLPRLPRRRLLALPFAFLAAALPAAAADAYPPLEMLLQTSTDVLGRPIAWPAGDPKVTAAIVTLAPGETTGLHRHGAPLFAYILQGEITVAYEGHGAKVYKQGDAVMEAFQTPHDGTSSGEVPVRILVVFMGSDQAVNTTSPPR